jgi:acetyl esterase/lipase
LVRRSALSGVAVVASLLVTAPAKASDPDPVCEPAKEPPAATVVVIQGGGFVLPGWANLGTCRALARHGFRAVNISYPLHDLPGAVRTTNRKLRRERRHGLPVCALGESSGGTLAELAAVEGRVPAAVAVAAPANLLDWSPGGAKSERQWSSPAAYWRDVGATKAERRAASPLFQVGERPSPLLLFHSPKDEVVPIAQSRSLARRVPSARLKRLRGRHLESQAFRKPAFRWLRANCRPPSG